MFDIVKIRFKFLFYPRITAKNEAQLRDCFVMHVLLKVACPPIRNEVPLQHDSTKGSCCKMTNNELTFNDLPQVVAELREIPGSKPGKGWVIYLDEIDKWLEANRKNPIPLTDEEQNATILASHKRKPNKSSWNDEGRNDEKGAD